MSAQVFSYSTRKAKQSWKTWNSK